MSFVNACSRPESALLLPLLLLPRAHHACSRGAHLCHPVANPDAPIGGLTVGEGGPAAAALHPPAAPGTAASAALHYFLLVFSNVDTATSTCIIVSCIYPLHTFSAWQRAQQPPLLPPPSPWRGAAAHIWGLPGSCKSNFDPVCRTAKVSPCKVISCSGLFGLAANGHAKSTAARRRCNGGTTSVPRMDPSRHVTPHFRLAASLRGSPIFSSPQKAALATLLSRHAGMVLLKAQPTLLAQTSLFYSSALSLASPPPGQPLDTQPQLLYEAHYATAALPGSPGPAALRPAM